MKRWAVVLLFICEAGARADSTCAEIRFKPAASDLQIVVWIEDAAGKVVDTPYITRLTGTFGLANRPGAGLLKTNFRWPYGRREMVLPIWAHRRDQRYPKVVMGGVCGNSPESLCPSGAPCAGQCADGTVAYHERVSSIEPFYCSPNGPKATDATSCASVGTFSKGAYAAPPAYSLYPPRADITSFNSAVDSPDLLDFPKRNDLVAISAATPPAGLLLDPPLVWYPRASLPPGDYVAFIELSQEYDFNPSHNHPNQNDGEPTWNFVGKQFLGQPSVVYQVPFRLDGAGGSTLATEYAGYSTWDGSDGVIHPPDGTLYTTPTPHNGPNGSIISYGAGRLAEVNDGVDVYRVKVVVGTCGAGPPDGGTNSDGGTGCEAPQPVTDLELVPGSDRLRVSFKAAPDGAPAARYAIRYRESGTPIPGEVFDLQVAGPMVSPGGLGASHEVEVTGLQAQTSYAIAVRATSACNGHSAVVSKVASTEAIKFTVLHGCFVATAAFGSPLAASVDALRRFRDRRLYGNPLGQLLAATYYAFGPPLASAISTDERLRALARAALSPIVALALRL